MPDKVIFITGGNTGIGLATALQFAANGVHVALLGRRAERNEAARAEIEGKGVRCLTFTGDVADEPFLADCIERTAAMFGRLDYAFNNAGVEEKLAPMIKQSAEEYQRVMDANVKGVWLSMKYQIPKMLQNGGGSIVNTSSIFGIVGTPNAGLYSASKHAVIGLTKSAALEYGAQNIRVNAVCPGAVRTEMLVRLIGDDPKMEKMMSAGYPLKRIGEPEEVASAVWWLCDGASWVTGQSISVDGGLTIQ